MSPGRSNGMVMVRSWYSHDAPQTQAHSSTLLSRFSLEVAPGVSPPASACSSATSSRLMKMFRWSRISLAESDTASRGVTDPLVQTSTVSLS